MGLLKRGTHTFLILSRNNDVENMMDFREIKSMFKNSAPPNHLPSSPQALFPSLTTKEM